MTMTSAKNSSHFLNVDFHLLAQDLVAVWHQLQGSRILGWFVPAAAVRVLRANGQAVVWITEGATVRGPASDKTRASFTAVELPDEYLLLRTMSLPPLADDEIARAVKLDAEGASPFPLSDIVWGYSAIPSGSAVQVRVAMASRPQISSYLEAVADRLPAGATPEVWALPEGFRPIVLGGFGEVRRLARARLRQRGSFALLLLAAVLALLIAATPVLQTRIRAVEALAAYEAVVKRAEPLVRQRTVLLRTIDSVNAVKEVLLQRSDPLFVMDLLTRALPDDTSLLGVQIQGAKVNINGFTTNTAALMQQLGSLPELRDVRAPTAATRSPGSPKDVFNIEFTLADRPPVAAPTLVALDFVAAVMPPAAAAIGQAPGTAGTPGSPLTPGAPVVPNAPPAVRPGGGFPMQPPSPPTAGPSAGTPVPGAATQAPAPGGASFGGASFGSPAAPAPSPVPNR